MTNEHTNGGNAMSLESSLTSNLATLLDGLRKGDMYRLDNAMLDPRVLSAVLDTEGFGRLERDMNREALLLQLDAVSRFCLEVLDSAFIGQSENSLLCSISDEVQRLQVGGSTPAKRRNSSVSGLRERADSAVFRLLGNGRSYSALAVKRPGHRLSHGDRRPAKRLTR